jgi:hypothetical protein
MAVSTIYRGVALGIGLALIPVAAFAVGVYSNDGDGRQDRTKSYSNGADVSGTLSAASGKTVYYAGRVALSGCSDPSVGRYSSNTSSTQYVTRGGNITTSIGTCGFQGVKSRVCTALTALPDPCGADSATY